MHPSFFSDPVLCLDCDWSGNSPESKKELMAQCWLACGRNPYDRKMAEILSGQRGFPVTAYIVEREVFMRCDDELLAEAA